MNKDEKFRNVWYTITLKHENQRTIRFWGFFGKGLISTDLHQYHVMTLAYMVPAFFIQVDLVSISWLHLIC